MKLIIKKWGSSAAIRLNKSILSQLNVEVGGTLSAEVNDGCLILTPAEPVYSIEELIAGSTKKSVALNDEDRQWLYAAPVGKEI